MVVNIESKFYEQVYLIGDNMKINSTNKGYALLFTMVIVSVIMVIATGISRSISKQLILSATAQESQIAFYEADTAAECALYASQKNGGLLLLVNPPGPGTIDCGPNTLDVTETAPGSRIYNIDPRLGVTGPCFSIEIDESSTPAVAQTYGYNICNAKPNDNRVVERGIEVRY
jgi:hypothetical protein